MRRHFILSGSRCAGLSALGLIALLTGCVRGIDTLAPPDPPDTTPPAPVVADPSSGVAPFDLGAMIQQVHFAYRPEGETFVGGDDSYAVRVSRGGQVAVAPFLLRAAEDLPEGAAPAPIAEAPALTLETVAADRGGIAIRASGARPEVDKDGSLVIHRDAFDERLHNAPAGVEQSWSFAEAPRGRGDLTLRVRTSGQDFAGATDSGLHFVDAASGMGLRYGLVTWVDAAGQRTELRSRYEEGEIVISVPGAVVDASAYPAVLDPTLIAEIGSDNPVYKPGNNFANRQDGAAVAFDGTNYLVVWADYRNGKVDIYGTRVSTSGVLLDPSGIAIATALDDKGAPKVAYNGSGYLVVWENDHYLGYGSYARTIRGGRVSKAGAVLSNFIISSTSNPQGPDLAYDGSNYYLVVWGSDAGIRGGRVSGAGALLDGEGFSVSTTDSGESSPAVACDPTNCLVVWDDARNGNTYSIYGGRVSHGGTRLDWPDGFLINGGTYDALPTVAWGNATYNVAWRQIGDDDVERIRYTAVTPAGVTVTPSGNDVSWFNSDRPHLAFGNSSFIVVYSGHWGAFSGTWVSGLPTNSKITGTWLFENNDAHDPTAVWGGTQILIEDAVQQGAPYNNERIHGLLMSF